jgi:PAS domain S-box-containing protein
MRIDPLAAALADSQDCAILVEDANHGVRYANQRWERLVAGRQDGIRALLDRLEPDEAVRADEKFSVAAGDGAAIHFQTRMTTPGARPWVQVARYPVHDGEGVVLAWVTSVSDRPVRSDSAMTVAPQDDVLAGVQRLLHVGAWDWRIEGDVAWWSDETAHMLGLAPAGSGDGSTALLASIHPDDRVEVQNCLERAFNGERPFDMRFRTIRPDGTEVIVHAQGQVVRDERGKPVRILGTIEDVSAEFIESMNAAHSARALATLRRGNRILPQVNDKLTLVREICAAAIDAGQYHLAWYGEIEGSDSPLMRLVDAAGPARGFVEGLMQAGSDRTALLGPISRAASGERTVVVADSREDPEFAMLREWADAFNLRSLIALPISVEGKVRGVLAVCAEEPSCFDQLAGELLEELALELGLGLDRIETTSRTMKALEATIRILASTVELRDPYTAGQQARVAELALAIGTNMGLDADSLHGMHLAGLVHDIGKVSIPAEILTRPGKLRPAERALIQEHAELGERLLATIEFPWPLAKLVGQHHERWNGSGYPHGLIGTEVLQGARVLAVADVVEAMSRFRPYREALGIGKAIEEITVNRGVLFDPDAVDACTTVLAEGFIFATETTLPTFE